MFLLCPICYLPFMMQRYTKKTKYNKLFYLNDTMSTPLTFFEFIGGNQRVYLLRKFINCFARINSHNCLLLFSDVFPRFEACFR